MRVHFAGNVAHIVGCFERHVAIGTLLRLRRIVERARAFARNSARLPVVVFVESAKPAVTIHRHVEMNFVTRGTELCRLLAHKRLEEDAPMRLWIQLDQEVVKRADHRILARCEFMQLGIFKVEIGLAHGAFHVGDGVAHHAAESGLGFGRVDDLFDRRIHFAGVEHGRIMASAAPFRRFGANGILHILDRLAIPLIVER